MNRVSFLLQIKVSWETLKPATALLKNGYDFIFKKRKENCEHPSTACKSPNTGFVTETINAYRLHLRFLLFHRQLQYTAIIAMRVA
jgi:hypothetical protein